MTLLTRIAAFGLFAITMNVVASAAIVTPSRGAVAAGCLGTKLSSGISDCSIGGAMDTANAGLATLNQTFIGSGDALNVSAAGNASFGILQASASASYSVSGAPMNAYAFGDAFFNDIITISFDPWNGAPGLLYVNYTLDGTVSTSGSGKALSRIQLVAGPDSDLQTRVQKYTSSISGSFSVGAPIQFVYGQPFNFSFLLGACAGGGDLCAGSLASGRGSGNADFFNTLVLSGLISTDMSGNQAVGAIFMSGSGTQYSTNGVTVVPEPSSFVLIAACALGAIWNLRKRSRAYDIAFSRANLAPMRASFD